MLKCSETFQRRSDISQRQDMKEVETRAVVNYAKDYGRNGKKCFKKVPNALRINHQSS